jgi:ribosome recycling factor
METNELFKELKNSMDKAIDHTLGELGNLHTGKASPSMLDGIKVSAYGSSMGLKECAAVTSPDAKTLSVQPWDKSILKEIEKAIQNANLGLNPIADGGLLRIPIPELTGERRQELVKTAGSIAEEGKIRIRQIRRDAIAQLKDAQKEGLSEDDIKRAEKDVQKEHDAFIEKINDALAHKEAELKNV